MDSCSVCYETFSSSAPGTVARQLPCEHVACTQCLEDCWEDGVEEERGVRCPECFELQAFDSVQAVPVVSRGEEEAAEGGAAGAALRRSSEEDPPSSTQDFLQSGAGSLSDSPPADRNADSAPSRTSKLAAFLSTNKAENHIPTFGAEADYDDVGCDSDGFEADDQRLNGCRCQVSGCPNRAVQNAAVCPMHTKRLSVVSVSAMVHKFKDTKLSSVALKSDKVEVKRGGFAGAGEAGFDPDAISERFRRQERLELGEAVALIEAVKNMLREEANMVEIDAPVMVVGDVHGQYFDLLNILKKWRPDRNLLFLGDYVDRGHFSCEVILHLFALKLRHPDKVHLIRGNHECSSVSAHFGFKEECKAKYGLTVYYRFLLAFQTMPICALIVTSIGRIFACHGGISPEITRLSDIEDIDRFAEPEMDGPLCDMLWADPLNEDDSHKLDDDEYQCFLETDFVANQVRGCSYMFGYNAVQRFLRENRLMYMVRAHEVQEEGFRSHFPSPSWALAAAAAAAKEDDFTDEDSDPASEEEQECYDEILADTSRHLNPTVLTVFSAPNYCDRYRNKAAILHIEKLGYYTVNLLEAEPHPDPVQETDMNVMQLLAMGNTCPYMPTSFREFLKVAVELGRAVKPASANNSMVADDLVQAAAAAAAAAAAVSALTDEEDGEGDGKGKDDEGGHQETEGGEEKDGEPHDREGARSSGDEATEPPDRQRRRQEQDEGEGEGEAEAEAAEGREEGAADGEDADSPLPSFAPKRRGIVSRMTSVPVIAAAAGWRRSSVSSNGSGVSWDRDQDDARGSAAVRKDGCSGGGSGEKRDRQDQASEPRISFLGAMSSLSRRSLRGLGLFDVASSSPRSRSLSRQNTWTGGSPTGEGSEHYRKAHARDGINEMHPEILNRRISSQESEAGGLRSSISSSLTTPPTGANTPEFSFYTPSLEGLLFGPQGLRGSSSRAKVVKPALARDDENEEEAGDDVEPSSAPDVRGIRRKFSLDMSVNIGSPQSMDRVRESRSRDELAAMMSTASIADLAQMEEDVQLEFDGLDNVSASESEAGGSSITLPNGSAIRRGSGVFSSGSNGYSSVSRGGSFDHEGMMTPSPRSRKSSVGDASPSQILFTHEEIVVLKLLFSLFDRKSKNFITRDDIIAYAEEGGDFAQLKEVDACMEAIDADMDGKVGLSDYINFAARLKEIHALQQAEASDGGEALSSRPSDETAML